MKIDGDVRDFELGQYYGEGVLTPSDVIRAPIKHS